MRALWLAVGMGFGFIFSAMADPSSPGAPARTTPAADLAWSQIATDAKRLRDAQTARDLEGLKSAVTQVRADAAAYVQKFPQDPHASGAKLMQAGADRMALGLDLPGAPTKDAILAEFRALATDPSVPMDVRVQASMADVQQVFMSVMAGAKDDPHDPAIWDALEARIEAFGKNAGDGAGQYPKQSVVILRQNQIMLLDRAGETARLQALLAQLKKSPQPEIVALAQEAQDKLQQNSDLKTKPLDLHFTALDGAVVDLAKLRGKVVLLDFWATWCPPCVEETPDVVAAYQKYHAQGFEIVGISLDQDKAALQKFIADHHMPWPQYFDGKGPDSDVVRRFGITAIPVMWLIGKDGIIATQDGGDDLDGQVGKLLAVP